MCLPRDEHFLSLVVDARGTSDRPRALVDRQGRSRLSARRIQRDFAPSHLPLFDSHFQCEMGVCEKVAHGSTASGNVEARNRVAVALKLAVLPLSLWRKVRVIRSKTYVHSPV